MMPTDITTSTYSLWECSPLSLVSSISGLFRSLLLLIVIDSRHRYTCIIAYYIYIPSSPLPFYDAFLVSFKITARDTEHEECFVLSRIDTCRKITSSSEISESIVATVKIYRLRDLSLLKILSVNNLGQASYVPDRWGGEKWKTYIYNFLVIALKLLAMCCCSLKSGRGKNCVVVGILNLIIISQVRARSLLSLSRGDFCKTWTFHPENSRQSLTENEDRSRSHRPFSATL